MSEFGSFFPFVTKNAFYVIIFLQKWILTLASWVLPLFDIWRNLYYYIIA